MKQKLFYALLSVVVIFGSTSTLSAQNPVDTLSVEAIEVIESDAISVLSSKVEQMDGEIERLQSELDHSVSQFSSNTPNLDWSDIWPFLIPIVAIIFGTTMCVLIVFFIARFAYLSSVKRYELKKMQIERGEHLNVQTEMPMIRFIRRLMNIGIVIFFILAWIALVSISGIGLFETILLMGLLGGVGFAVVHLFKQYVKRRDEEK